MIDPNKVIRVRPMIYSQEDIEDFKIQINELIQLNMIRESKSVKPEKNSIFLKKGKTVISVENRKFSRSHMTKRTASLNPSREI